MIWKILSVIGLSSFEIYVALALAAGVGLTLWQTLICTMIGGVVGAFISLFLGQKIENWINTYLRKNKEPKPKKGLLFRIWNKYGEWGLSILGTMFFGAPATIGIAVGFNANIKRMFPVIVIIVVVRCFTFTFLGDWLERLI